MTGTRRLALAALLLAGPAAAQDNVETFDFEGGKLTITEKDTGEKDVAFNGTLLASNYFVSFDREVEVGGTKVALVTVGEGGNACAPGTLIVWKNGDEVVGDYVGNDCGAPPPAVSSDRILFVPYMLPGATEDLMAWSPDERIHLAGRLSFAPQPGTTWAEFDPAKLNYTIDALSNAEIFQGARTLLGGELTDVATALSVSSGFETLPSGAAWATGCVPHACGVSDGFMAVDAKTKKLYFGQQQDKGSPKAWPDAKSWPADIRDAMTKAIGGRQ